MLGKYFGLILVDLSQWRRSCVGTITLPTFSRVHFWRTQSLILATVFPGPLSRALSLHRRGRASPHLRSMSFGASLILLSGTFSSVASGPSICARQARC